MHALHIAMLAFSFAGDVDFNINKACLKEDPELLARAKAAYDTMYKTKQPAAPAQSNGGELSVFIPTCVMHCASFLERRRR